MFVKYYRDHRSGKVYSLSCYAIHLDTGIKLAVVLDENGDQTYCLRATEFDARFEDMDKPQPEQRTE